MWNIYGNLELKKESNFHVINSYANTPSDNYNLYFRGTNQKVILDNPNNFVIHTKNANVLPTTNSVEINLKTPRLNL